MPEHVHVHVPHELTETGDHAPGHQGLSNRERVFELAAILLMSLSTLGVAWSGYQAARWSGLQAREYAQANAARTDANRTSTLAGQQRLQDLLNFNRWLETTTQGEPDLADLYERRFTPEFRPAFDAWTAQGDPLHDPDAVASPLLMPEYAPAALARADELESEAEEHFNEGKEATENADKYIFGTVFFAAVLFFAGMSLRFEWPALRLAVLGLAALFLAYGVVQIASLPTM